VEEVPKDMRDYMSELRNRVEALRQQYSGVHLSEYMRALTLWERELGVHKSVVNAIETRLAASLLLIYFR
jgi:hypothetical protein